MIIYDVHTSLHVGRHAYCSRCLSRVRSTGHTPNRLNFGQRGIHGDRTAMDTACLFGPKVGDEFFRLMSNVR